MKQKIIRRLFFNLITLWIIITISFIVKKQAPGNPLDQEKALNPEIALELKKQYDFNYIEYWRGLLHGDLGYSYRYLGMPVSEIILESLPVSLELGALALIAALIFGLATALASLYIKEPIAEHLILGLALTGIIIPSFILGPILQMFFSLQLKILPVAGWYSWSNRILPVLALSLAYGAYMMRLFRGSLQENQLEAFILTALVKGLSETQIFFRHLLPNSLIPLLNFLGPATAALLTGTLVIEKIFNIPGLGRYFIDSALQRDYPIALGIITVYSILLLILNLIVDIVQSWIDPRIDFNG